jgi:hypothetical protein
LNTSRGNMEIFFSLIFVKSLTLPEIKGSAIIIHDE